VTTDAENTPARTPSWYAVRCIFASEDNKPWGPYDLASGHVDYEERVTLWLADSFADALARAEAEAADHAATLECEYVGLAQAYALPDAPQSGIEVFSMIRRSTLEPDDYVDAFFDTGTEHQADLRR
jgi:hypothetical protein